MIIKIYDVPEPYEGGEWISNILPLEFDFFTKFFFGIFNALEHSRIDYSK